MLLQIRIQGYALIISLDANNHLLPCRDRRGLFAQSTHQAFLSEGFGSELEDQRAHLRQCAARQFSQLGDRSAQRPAVIHASPDHRQLSSSSVHGHREESLADRVMQVASEMRTLERRGYLSGLRLQSS